MLFVSVPRRLLCEITTRSVSQVSAAEKPAPPRTALIIGGGIIGISSALQLARRGLEVTVVEECPEVSQVASFRNGAILCQSMAASWASAHLLSENPGEMKSLRLGWRALTDLNFLVWSAWFWYNSLRPSRAQHNHQSCRLLAWLRSTIRTENISGNRNFVFLQSQVSGGGGAGVRGQSGDEQDGCGNHQVVPRQERDVRLPVLQSGW